MRAAALAGRPGRAAKGFIIVTVALDVLAIGIVIPVLPHLVLSFLGEDSAHAAMTVDNGFVIRHAFVVNVCAVGESFIMILGPWSSR